MHICSSEWKERASHIKNIRNGCLERKQKLPENPKQTKYAKACQTSAENNSLERRVMRSLETKRHWFSLWYILCKHLAERMCLLILCMWAHVNSACVCITRMENISMGWFFFLLLLFRYMNLMQITFEQIEERKAHNWFILTCPWDPEQNKVYFQFFLLLVFFYLLRSRQSLGEPNYILCAVRLRRANTYTHSWAGERGSLSWNC